MSEDSGFRIQDSDGGEDPSSQRIGAHIGLNPESRILNPVLLIGYGNGLRGDDAIGIVIAEAVDAWNLPNVKVIACHQLTPELSEDISEAALVIFADAAVTGKPGEVSVTSVEPADPTTSSAHAGDPARLLGLAQVVFRKCPPAWTVTVVAEDMGFREGLTEIAQRGVEDALERVREMAVGSRNNPGSSRRCRVDPRR